MGPFLLWFRCRIPPRTPTLRKSFVPSITPTSSLLCGSIRCLPSGIPISSLCPVEWHPCPSERVYSASSVGLGYEGSVWPNTQRPFPQGPRGWDSRV